MATVSPSSNAWSKTGANSSTQSEASKESTWAAVRQRRRKRASWWRSGATLSAMAIHERSSFSTTFTEDLSQSITQTPSSVSKTAPLSTPRRQETVVSKIPRHLKTKTSSPWLQKHVDCPRLAVSKTKTHLTSGRTERRSIRNTSN